MHCVEYFFESYQHTFSAIAAIGTMLAVIIALRKYKPKIYAEFKIDRKDFFVEPKDQPSWNFVVVDIINLESMPVQIQINSFRNDDREILFPIDYVDNSGFQHPLEDIVHKYEFDNVCASHNPLKKDMKEYPILINSGESKKFYFFLEKEYIDSFVNKGRIKKIFMKMGLFFLVYRPQVMLYDKFIFRIRLSKELKTKIREVIKQ